jgi:ATP-dependent helicase/nuclease subunit A
MDRRQLLREVEHADDALVQQYDTLFSYEYPYKSQAGRKSKYSVSELKHDSMVRQYDQQEGEAEVPEFLLEDREPYVPDFALAAEPGARGGEGAGEQQSETGVGEPQSDDTPENRRTQNAGGTGSGSTGARQHDGASPGAKRGTAVHRVMECLDFTALSRIDTQDEKAVGAFVRQELVRMRESGELTEEWYRLVPPAMIERFAKSPVAHRMAQAAVRGDLYREKPFVMQHEDVLVQGIIDVFWLEGDAIVLLDYKTDRVQKAEELVLRYKTQLELYADALARVFSNEQKKMTAEERLLYSFRLQEVIAV